MPPKITDPGDNASHPKTSYNFTMTNAHGSHAASQIYSWRVKVGSVLNGYNYYLGTEIISNGSNTQFDTAAKPKLPGNQMTCYTKPEYRKVQGGPWYSGDTTIFTCTG